MKKVMTCLLISLLSTSACSAASLGDNSSLTMKKSLTPINVNGGVWEDNINSLVEVSQSGAGVKPGDATNTFDKGKYYRLPKYNPKYVSHKDCVWTTYSSPIDGDTFRVDWAINKWGEVVSHTLNSSGNVADEIAIRTIGIDTDEISSTGGIPTDKGFDQAKYAKKILEKGDAVCLLFDKDDKSYNRYLRWVLIDKPIQVGDMLGLTVDATATQEDDTKIKKDYKTGEFAKSFYPTYDKYYNYNWASIMVANTDAKPDCGRFITTELPEVRNDVKGCGSHVYI